ncbi:MAG: FliH/SctL family protein [Epsilonproteobacteria bacterium]|nr:FliH/SctL family protein [Campylobacterota bacterium]
MIEDVIITKENLNDHTVGKYQFKILSALNGASVHEAAEELGLEHTKSTAQEKQSYEAPQTSNSHKDELIESLLKKADEMSSNFIKMQMKLETLQEEHASALESAKKISYDEGLAAGMLSEQSQDSKRKEQAQEQLSNSVKTLETAASQFNNALESIQKELTHTALEIAREVIGIETQENGAKIAAKLSEDLIEELGEASKITLRVNPADHGFISEKVGSLAHVEVLSDRAISQGGVVAISDLGNIDSQIKKRFERLKRSLLLEN